jgi:hypothetical protein
MKVVSIILALVLGLAGGAMSVMSPAAQAQVIVPGLPQAAAVPWVGANTPWTFYNGDWFLNGVLYYFFGNQMGWAPYYAYAPTYIVRPTYWYAPRWNTWYKAHPTYWTNFERRYPYWHGHRAGQHYDQNFYNRYHHGQGGGWQKGFPAGAHHPAPPAGRNYQPGTSVPGRGPLPPAQPGQFQPGPAQRQPGQYHPGAAQTQPSQYHPGPAQRQPGQYQVAPAQKQPGQYQPGTPAQRQPGQYQPGSPAQRQPGQYQAAPAQKQPGQYQPGTPASKQAGPGREATQPQHRKPPEEPSTVR